jgi:hypothetical protein
VVLYQLAVTRLQLGQREAACSLVQRILGADSVGNAYALFRDNPMFQLLEENAECRRAMAVYRA